MKQDVWSCKKNWILICLIHAKENMSNVQLQNGPWFPHLRKRNNIYLIVILRIECNNECKVCHMYPGKKKDLNKWQPWLLKYIYIIELYAIIGENGEKNTTYICIYMSISPANGDNKKSCKNNIIPKTKKKKNDLRFISILKQPKGSKSKRVLQCWKWVH